MGRSVSDSATPGPENADIAAFCRVVDLGSVTAAAQSLGETKGSVSRRLARLERALGVPVLERHGRGVVPTEAGQLYRERAGAALEGLDEAAATVRDQGGSPSGHLRVTAPLGIGAMILGPAVAPFILRYPGITLELELTDKVLSFERDRIDVALRLSSALPDSTLVATKLMPMVATLVAAPAYLAQRPAPSHPQDFEDHSLLVPPLRGVATPLAWVHSATHERYEGVFRGRILSHDLLLLREAALGGGGIAMAPPPLVEADLAAGRLVEVLPQWRLAGEVSLWMVTRGGPAAPKVRAFRDHLQAAVAGLPCKAQPKG